MGGMDSGNNGKGKLGARVAGAACAGSLEISLFHPVDTIAKRLMNNSSAVNSGNVGSIIFKNHAGSPPLQRLGSLFPGKIYLTISTLWLSRFRFQFSFQSSILFFVGIGYGAAYKLSQRVYKFGGQPYVREFMRSRHGAKFDSIFGDKYFSSLRLQYKTENLERIEFCTFIMLFEMDVKVGQGGDKWICRKCNGHWRSSSPTSRRA